MRNKHLEAGKKLFKTLENARDNFKKAVEKARSDFTDLEEERDSNFASYNVSLDGCASQEKEATAYLTKLEKILN